MREELAYDREEMEHAINVAMNGEGPNQAGKFTPSQRKAFDAIKDAIQGKSNEKQIYIDARGGT